MMCEHDWQPLKGERGAYWCACGVVGYRAGRAIKPYADQARWKGYGAHVVRLMAKEDGRVPACPTLDYYDRAG